MASSTASGRTCVFAIQVLCGATLTLGSARAADSVPPVEAPAAEAEVKHRGPDFGPCDRGIGFAGGVTHGLRQADWSLQSGDWGGTFSPVLAASCGRQWLDTAHPWVGAEMMPLFTQVRRDGYAARQFASGSIGVMFGNGNFRLGPYGTIGWAALGGGLAATIGSNGGVEMRLAYHHVGDHVLQAVFVYNLPQPKSRIKAKAAAPAAAPAKVEVPS